MRLTYENIDINFTSFIAISLRTSF
jgi:hypothetical protein